VHGYEADNEHIIADLNDAVMVSPVLRKFTQQLEQKRPIAAIQIQRLESPLGKPQTDKEKHQDKSCTKRGLM